jgi:SAM-dependent methyltransferase
LVAIDRSAKAITAAALRNAESVEAGMADFRTAAVEDVDAGELGTFDKVFAVNVNLFWVRSAQPELEIIAKLLTPEGQLLLVYDPPDVGTANRQRALLTDHLEQAGYRRCRTTTRTAGASTLVAVTALAPVGG